ncbi:MAG: alpha/beta hydrolase [Pseudomonadota bacterium]
MPATKNPTMLMLHGIFRRSDDFDELRDRLGSDVRLETPDQLGHGSAPRAAGYRILDYADYLAPRLEELAGEPLILFGHSLGGVVALALAGRHPEWINALILEDPPLFSITAARRPQTRHYGLFQKLRELKRGPGADFSEADWIREIGSWPSGTPDETNLSTFGRNGVALRARQMMDFDIQAVESPLDGSMDEGFDAEALLAALTCPTKILTGDPALGAVISVEDRANIETIGDPVTVQIVPGVGHNIHELKPAVCEAAIRKMAQQITNDR